jgi:hypothetical protein
MHKIIYCLAIVIYSNFVFADQAKTQTEQPTPKAPVDHKKFVKEFCENYDSQKDFYKKMSKEILSDEKMRKQFISDLTQKKLPGCELALKDFMKGILAENDYTPKAGEQAYLSIALIAKIPEASEVIEREIDKGFLSSWIDTLKETNDNAYIQSLNNWIKRVATEIRKKDDTKILDPSLYGKLPFDGKGIKYPDMVRIWTPILMNRYLSEMVKRKTKLDVEQFGYLNIIFAATTTSYRETFLDQIAEIVFNNPQTWILSYRKEPAWVEFRLFPIMKKAGGGEIKREMIWLSKYHQDGHIRTLAISTLEALASTKKETTATGKKK